ncbi:hypothetical protein F5Y16DRAFT_377138 [Xylariaceae sp. FL0255]|nr:hypothetical protein F5Y16DRAFT_377138 [Xylariaceae sp. FL0255]
MEYDGDTWVLNTLQGLLPEQTVQLLHDHVIHPSSTLRTLSSYFLLSMAQVISTLKPIIAPIAAPLADRALRALQDSPDLAVLIFVLACLGFAFYLMILVQRTIKYMTRLAFTALFYMLVGLVVMAIYQRGLEATIKDLVVVVSKMFGYAAVVKDIWLSEYQKYDAQTRGSAASSTSYGAGGGSSSRPLGSAGRRGGRV